CFDRHRLTGVPLLPGFAGREQRGVPGEDRAPARPRAAAGLDLGRVAVHDLHPLELEPELVGAHLREHRLQALAHIRASAAYGRPALRTDYPARALARRRPEPTEPAALHERSDPDPETPRRVRGLLLPELLVPERLERALEHRGGITALVDDRLAPILRPRLAR